MSELEERIAKALESIAETTRATFDLHKKQAEIFEAQHKMAIERDQIDRERLAEVKAIEAEMLVKAEQTRKVEAERFAEMKKHGEQTRKTEREMLAKLGKVTGEDEPWAKGESDEDESDEKGCD
jgi:hypothetical protein